MPPWPGVPPNPKAEGHYWIVSKNLIELLACLVVATTPSGYWIGLDALFSVPGAAVAWREQRPTARCLSTVTRADAADPLAWECRNDDRQRRSTRPFIKGGQRWSCEKLALQPAQLPSDLLRVFSPLAKGGKLLTKRGPTMIAIGAVGPALPQSSIC